MSCCQSLDAFSRAESDKCVWRWGSFSAPQDPLAAIEGGVLLLRGREGRDREGRRLPPLYLTSGYGLDVCNSERFFDKSTLNGSVVVVGLSSGGLDLHIIVLSCLCVMVNRIFRPYMSQLVCIQRCLTVL